MPEPEAIAGSGAETGVTFPAPGAGAHPAAAPQSIAPTLFGIEEETQRHRHKQRVIMSLYNPEPPAARPTAEKPAPAPAAGDAAKPVAGRPQLPTDSPATDSPEPVSGSEVVSRTFTLSSGESWIFLIWNRETFKGGKMYLCNGIPIYGKAAVIHCRNGNRTLYRLRN